MSLLQVLPVVVLPLFGDVFVATVDLFKLLRFFDGQLLLLLLDFGLGLLKTGTERAAAVEDAGGPGVGVELQRLRFHTKLPRSLHQRGAQGSGK